MTDKQLKQIGNIIKYKLGIIDSINNENKGNVTRLGDHKRLIAELQGIRQTLSCLGYQFNYIIAEHFYFFHEDSEFIITKRSEEE